MKVLHTVLGVVALAGMAPAAFANNVGENYAWQFQTSADKVNQAVIQDMIQKKKSGYYFPGLGEVYFVQDADARDPLVMLASLVGKYVRELLMARISRFHGADSDEERVSGYHDPKTSAWVTATQRRRRALLIVDDCFERARDAAS